MSEAFAPGLHLIEAYGGGQFNFAGMRHVGAILATPKGVRAVEATDVADIDEARLAPLFAELAEAPGSVEFLSIGTGSAPRRLSASTVAALRAAGLRHETMATGPAARVYNVMAGEGRRVAALLLPAP